MRDNVRFAIEAFLRVQAFGRENWAGADPASYVAQKLAVINTMLTELETYTGAQATGLGSARQSTLKRAAARRELLSLLNAISRTARTMEELDPTLYQQFRVPHGEGDQALRAAAVSFATAARPLEAEFVRRGLTDNFIEDLELRAEALREAVGLKIESRRSHVTATANIDSLIERGLKAVRQLDCFMRNTYANDPAKLAAWVSASRVERRTPRGQTEGQPASTTPPAG
jgi:hypothetical protein